MKHWRRMRFEFQKVHTSLSKQPCPSDTLKTLDGELFIWFACKAKLFRKSLEICMWVTQLWIGWYICIEQQVMWSLYRTNMAQRGESKNWQFFSPFSEQSRNSLEWGSAGITWNMGKPSNCRNSRLILPKLRWTAISEHEACHVMIWSEF